MNGRSRAIAAGIVSLSALGAVSGVAFAAPVPAAAATAALKVAPAQSLIEPVHYYSCVVRRCGPYRCVWVNRCRRPYRWGY